MALHDRSTGLFEQDDGTNPGHDDQEQNQPAKNAKHDHASYQHNDTKACFKHDRLEIMRFAA